MHIIWANFLSYSILEFRACSAYQVKSRKVSMKHSNFIFQNAYAFWAGERNGMRLYFRLFTDLFPLHVASVTLQHPLKLLVVMCGKKALPSHSFPPILDEGDVLIFWFDSLASTGVTAVSPGKYLLNMPRRTFAPCSTIRQTLFRKHCIYLSSPPRQIHIIIPTLQRRKPRHRVSEMFGWGQPLSMLLSLNFEICLPSSPMHHKLPSCLTMKKKIEPCRKEKLGTDRDVSNAKLILQVFVVEVPWRS